MTSTKKEKYHPAGCCLFIATYLHLLATDAAGHLADPFLAARAEENDRTALAVLKNGAAGRYSDPLVDAAAIVTGKQPAAIFQQLLATAATEAHKEMVTGIQRRGRRAAWNFKIPAADFSGVRKAS
jgi:hypothetical protein